MNKRKKSSENSVQFIVMLEISADSKTFIRIDYQKYFFLQFLFSEIVVFEIDDVSIEKSCFKCNIESL